MRTLFLVLMCLIIDGGSSSFAKTNKNPALPQLITPAWFIQKEFNGLTYTKTGRLLYRKDSLPLVPQSGDLFGAAYYPAVKSLLTVSKKGTVHYYLNKKGVFSLVGKFSPKDKVGTESIRFTRVPGLVYVLTIDVKLEKALKGHGGYLKSSQFYPDRYYRVALTKPAQSSEGIPVAQSKEKLLGGWYQTQGKKLSLTLSDGGSASAPRISLTLLQPLALPFRSGPYDDLAQAVFVFPGKGIVCLTKDGWALASSDGKLKKWFSTREVKDGWWSDPTLEQGSFYVNRRTGPGGDTYRMDVAKGRLVKVKR